MKLYFRHKKALKLSALFNGDSAFKFYLSSPEPLRGY